MIDTVAIGRRLRDERDRLGLSPNRAAAIFAVPVAEQELHEAGGRAPDCHYLATAIGAGFDIGYVLTGARHSAYPGNGAPGEPLPSGLDIDVEFGFLTLTGALKALSGLIASGENGSTTMEELGSLVALVGEKADSVFAQVKSEAAARRLAA